MDTAPHLHSHRAQTCSRRGQGHAWSRVHAGGMVPKEGKRAEPVLLVTAVPERLFGRLIAKPNVRYCYAARLQVAPAISMADLAFS